MNWNIFSGLDTKAAVSQAKLKVEQLQEQHKDMNEQVRLDVQNAYLKSQRDRGPDQDHGNRGDPGRGKSAPQRRAV